MKVVDVGEANVKVENVEVTNAKIVNVDEANVKVENVEVANLKVVNGEVASVRDIFQKEGAVRGHKVAIA